MTTTLKIDSGFCNLPPMDKQYSGFGCQLLDEKQAAARLSVAVKTLQNWRSRGGGPLFTKLGGGKLVRYREADLLSFIEHGVRSSTSDGGN